MLNGQLAGGPNKSEPPARALDLSVGSGRNVVFDKPAGQQGNAVADTIPGRTQPVP
jgi:hypothetical protein